MNYLTKMFKKLQNVRKNAMNINTSELTINVQY